MVLNKILQELQKAADLPRSRAQSLHPALYRSQDLASLENERIFKQGWFCPGLAAELGKPGDYMTYSLADDPLFTIRDKAGKTRTFSNVCRHRMMILLGEAQGSAPRITCPYHAWTYDLNGSLVGAGHMEGHEDFDKSKLCLPEIRTEIWQGWIYVTLNADALSVKECLSDLQPVVEPYGMASYVPVLKEDHIWQTNWKLLTENFMEGYHLPVAHKATVGAWFPVEKTKFPDKSFDHFTYQIFKKTGDASYGIAHPDNKRLTGRWRSISVMPTIFPCHMFVLAPDHLWYLSLRPRGVEEVQVRFGVAIAPEIKAQFASRQQEKSWVTELTSFFEHVNQEDREVVEGIYAGAQASLSQAGPLSWLEREIHDFQAYLNRSLNGEKQNTKSKTKGDK